MNNREPAEAAILEAVLPMSVGERAAYLDSACGGDIELRRRVEALLGAFDRASGFMTTPAISSPARSGPPLLPPAEKPGDRIGRYKLLEQIGEGGCGVVYVAEQEEPVRRRVALKVIKLGMDTRQVIARFEAERQALAMMDHPNIAKVHDGGATETGRPYFVMELVRGVKITDYCDQNHLAPRERLDLFIQVCRAIQHAHQKGIIHRDIKPSNILVTLDDGVPVPKVIDFGIAKATQGRLTDQTVYTAFEQFIGTPAYMSPEQAEISGLDIDTRSDIYSLGVLLYELLTGTTPFDAKELLAKGLDEMRRTILEAEPIKPSTRLTHERAKPEIRRPKAETKSAIRNPQSAIPSDLDWIVMKCLEKDRTRRYETANGLAADIARHLGNEPVIARPPSALYRFQKSLQRNKLAFGAALLVFIAVVLAMVVLAVSNFRTGAAQRGEKAERQKSDAANRELRQTVRVLELQRAEDIFRAGDEALGAVHLAAQLRRDPSNHIAASRLVSALVHRNWSLPAAPAMRHGEQVKMVSFSPDGTRVLSVSHSSTARIWDAQTSRELATLQHADRIFSAQYSPDGARIVTASADGTARLWDGTSGAPLTPPLQHQGKVFSAEFNGSGDRIVTASADKTARIWDSATGALKLELRGHTTPLILARFSPDGEKVATGGEWGSIRIWSAVTGQMLSQPDVTHGRLTTLAFSPDGRRLVSSYERETAVRLWDVATGQRVCPPLTNFGEVNYALFSPDSRLLLVACVNGSVNLWNAENGHAEGRQVLHEGAVTFAVFSPDGKTIITTSSDNSARLWNPRDWAPLSHRLRFNELVEHAAFSPDGQRVVTASDDGIAQIWNVEPRRYVGIETRLGDDINSVAYSRDGKFLIAASRDRTARVLDPGTGQVLAEPLRHDAGVQFADFAPEGQRVVTTSRDGKARVWNWRTGQLLAGPFQHGSNIWLARFSPLGDRVATASADGTARVWNARTGEPITPPLVHTGEVLTAEFNPDGRLIVTASEDHSARVWDAHTGEPLSPPLLHRDSVLWARFSPDGEKVLTASRDNTACLWDWRRAEKVIPPLQHTRTVKRAVFSPEGRRIATCSLDLTARIWDVATGQALTPPMKGEEPLAEVGFSLDGQRLLTSDAGGRTRLWDSNTGLPLSETLRLYSALGRIACCFDPTGERITAGGWGGIVRVWDVPPPPTPVPDWFPTFVEAIAGVRLGARGNLEIVPTSEFAAISERLQHKNDQDFYARVARWYVNDPAQRAIHPFRTN